MSDIKQEKESDKLSLRKKTIFYIITISIPVLFFVGLEMILRSSDYMGNLDLFIDVDVYEREYRVPNPNFAARYFFYTKTVPTPSTDGFLKEKPQNAFRVFSMGGSSAAGYPYGFNGLYSRVVRDVLEEALPHKEVEVVNVGISAINTYTLYDQVDEIIEEQPDAILIYAGHNEFYGALGVGSNENLGGFPGFVRFYLKIQRFKTFLFLRNMIVESGKWFAETFTDSDYDESATLMERIVDSRSIELDSPKYELAKVQFESNMRTIIEKFEKAGVPVLIGSVVSNLKDHHPFVSIENGDYPPASQVFEEAQQLLVDGDSAAALEKFIYAKDLDGLKFRAPTEINDIIKDITETTNAVYVPVEENFSESSPAGLIGFNLMLEHLHPNSDGYRLIGESFAKKIQEMEYFGTEGFIPFNDWNNLESRRYLSEFDHRVSWHRVRTLKQGWPFVTTGRKIRYQESYKTSGIADSLAFFHVHGDLTWDKAKVDLAEHYTRTNQLDRALFEYNGLIRNQPWNDSPYIFASRLFLDRNMLAEAEPYLRGAYQINPENAFTNKMLGAIELNNGNVNIAIGMLQKSVEQNPRDAQALFNLSGAYGLNKEYEKALDIIVRVQKINPNFPGAKQWYDQLNRLIN